MHMHGVDPLSLSSPMYVLLIIFLSHFTDPSNCALPESFVYVGCSQLKYSPGSPYEANVNSVLSSIVNSASLSSFNKFKISLPGSAPSDVVYGLFQCRGDLGSPDCHGCIASAVSRLGASCVGATGGAMQLDGCFVRYDNTSFIGDEDTTVVFNKCGPATAGDTDLLIRKDAVLTFLTAGGQFSRVAASGKVQGVAQCTQDLSTSECQDCLSEAIQRLQSECGSSPWGNMFLGKCYARYSEGEYTSKSENAADDEAHEMERTLAILIGLIACAAVLVVLLSYFKKKKLFEQKGGK